MKKFVGKLQDLTNLKSYSINGKSRYFCPYCDSIHKKEPDIWGCVVFDQSKLSGYCFRCSTPITHDGLQSLDYLESKLNKSELKETDQILKINWLSPALDNEKVTEYLNNRFIFNSTIKRFRVKACSDPFDTVVFINKEEELTTDFLQARFINNPKQNHAFLRDITKKLCWLHHASTPDLILCEGFISGLSAYQHSNGSLHPIILGGKTITPSQLLELKNYTSKHKSVNITVCLDGGFFEDTLKAATKIYQSTYNTVIKVMPMPYNRDLNEITTEEFNFWYKSSLLFTPSDIKYIRNKVYKGNDDVNYRSM